MAIERMSFKVNDSFDPAVPEHLQLVFDAVRERGRGVGWVMSSYNPEDRILSLTRGGLLTQVSKGDADTHESYRVELRAGTRVTDGEAVAADLESDPQHAGYFMTRFNPFGLEARMTRLNPGERRAREAVAAAMLVKPWDVQVQARPDGGYALELPKSYIPSKHDQKLQEVAEAVVGRFGWYFESDPQHLTGELVPSAPPTFPAEAPYPMTLLPSPALGVIPPLPIGLALAPRGDEDNVPTFLNFGVGPHTQIGGLTNSGKSVSLNVIIAGALAAGAELAIFDVPQKAVDFDAWRPFVRRGGWGATSFEENAVALQELYLEGQQRAETLRRYGAKKLADLPDDMKSQMRPVLIIVDEYTGLLSRAAVPKALDYEHPLRIEAEGRNLAIDLISSYVDKIAAEMRFVGFHLVIATQVASTQTGISTALRSNLPNKILWGARATDGNRKLIFRDPTSIPDVPPHIATDETIARGVGAAELEGQRSVVLKGYYASEEQLIQTLIARGRTPTDPGVIDTFTRPPRAAVNELFPRLSAAADAQRWNETERFAETESKHSPDQWEVDPDTGKPLRGYARANAARAELARSARDAAATPGP